MALNGSPMTVQEIYDSIILNNLYSFKAAIPAAIVRSEIRKHCLDVNFETASKTKHFKLVETNKYYFLEKPIKIDHKKQLNRKVSRKNLGVEAVKSAQRKHQKEFKESVIKLIKKINPIHFENFTKNLLEAYGFEDVEVTRFSRDGGIDGFGRMKVGLGVITVAFQCKRYSTKSVTTKEIQEFRGSIQGKCEQGLFFTTSQYTKNCEELMFQPGAVPIIMIDGQGIVDIMIEKKFGVEIQNVPIFINALDLTFDDN